MKKTNFADKNIKELAISIEEAKKTLVDLSVQKAQRKIKNLHDIREKRKELARMLTAVREKELKQ